MPPGQLQGQKEMWEKDSQNERLREEPHRFSPHPRKSSVKLAPYSTFASKGFFFFLEAGKGAKFCIAFAGVKIANS